MNIPEQSKQLLLETQRAVTIACWLGWSYDVGGNSYNAHEALGGLKAAFFALGLEWEHYEPTSEELREAVLAADGDPEDYDFN